MGLLCCDWSYSLQVFFGYDCSSEMLLYICSYSLPWLQEEKTHGVFSYDQRGCMISMWNVLPSSYTIMSLTFSEDFNVYSCCHNNMY